MLASWLHLTLKGWESVSRMHAGNHQQVLTQVQVDECDETNVINDYLQLKEEHGGPYVEFQ